MRHSSLHTLARPSTALALGLALLLPLLGGCASSSTSTDNEIDPNEDETFRPLGPASRDADTIGKYLTDLSVSIRAWNDKTLTASTTQERRKQSLLEINIRERVSRRHEEILVELETGPKSNRIVAAAALGFSGDPADVSPLLASLDDHEEKVVSNALMSLGNLGSPETPLNRIGELMRFSPDSNTRWSAADCALSLIAAGADSDGVLEAARAGLTDAEEPMVRTQSALILGLIGDSESIEAMGNLLFDEIPIVSNSAGKSLAYMGKNDPSAASDCARALYRAMADGDRELKIRVHPNLVALSQRDYELEVEDWEKWVRKLP